jgi:outer membrane protein OmpA-like peptidoglycan-associated protein
MTPLAGLALSLAVSLPLTSIASGDPPKVPEPSKTSECCDDGPARAREKLAGLAKLLRELEGDIANQQKSCQDMAGRHREQLEASAKQLASMKEQMEKLARDHDLTKKNLTETSQREVALKQKLEQEATTSAAMMKDHQAMVTQWQQEREGMAAKLKDASGQVAKAELAISTLTGKVQEQTKGAEASAKAINEMTAKYTAETGDLKKKNEALMAEGKALTTRMGEAEAAARKQLDDLKTALQKSEVSRAEVMAKLDTATKTSIEQGNIIQKLEAKNVEASEMKRTFEADLANARETLNLATSRLEKARALMTEGGVVQRIKPVYYDAGSEDNLPELDRVLKDARRVLDVVPEARFAITGFASEDGSFEANMRLSARRAEKIGLHLQSNGIPADRITLTAAGSTRSMAAKNSGDKNSNRRVDIQIESISK